MCAYVKVLSPWLVVKFYLAFRIDSFYIGLMPIR